MATRFGLDAATRGLTSNLRGRLLDKLTMSTHGLIITGRVQSIVLDQTHPRFAELGEWNGLGTIEFTSVSQPVTNTSITPTAKPVFPNLKTLPLTNELVYLIAFPNTNIGTDTNSVSYYYINSIGLWNHPHHNGYPVDALNPPPAQQKDYIQTTLGSVRRITDNTSEISLGKTFQERSNIHPLLPFEGDVIVEGRFGNSIRLGSTTINKTTNVAQNNWSEGQTTPSDPITIIRNGQDPNSSDEGWIPITEEVNKDIASIYLTSTQAVPIQPATQVDTAYDTAPTKPQQYSGKSQIILNANRLLLNSKTDSILLTSGGTIGIGAQNSVNITAKRTIVLDSPNIRLGSTNAQEPLLKGQQTVDLLNKLLTNLNEFMKVCQTQAVPIPNQNPIPLGKLNQASTQMSTVLEGLLKQVDDLKSKTNFTI